MNDADSELLKRYSGQGDEAAFADLVGRYADLVYSAALRQTLQDSGDAEEVTQRVFTELARKASRLDRHSSIAGWLYTCTRLAAMEFRRSEVRRRVRDSQFAAMNEPETSSNPNPEWEKIRPLLDEAMDGLTQIDRDAVLLRYFERRPLAEVGQRLGLTDNAARMRITRALDRLQTILAKRGIVSTSAALALVLGQHAVAAAPVGLTDRIGSKVLAPGSSLPALDRVRWPVATGAIVVVVATFLVGIGVWTAVQRTRGQAAIRQSPTGVATPLLKSSSSRPRALADSKESIFASSATIETAGESLLSLQILASDTGQAIPGAIVGQTIWTAPSFQGMTAKRIAADRSGVVWVHIPTNAHRVRLTSRTDGYVDTQMRWDVINGEQVPTNYVVRLDWAPVIGGRVVDSREQPVADAEVNLQLDERPSDRHGIESHAFGQVKALTDSDGRWSLARIAPEMIEKSRISASHAEYQPVDPVDLPSHPDAVALLRNQSHVLRLAAAQTLRGVVTDTAGHVLPDALVSVRRPTVRETHTTAYGEFVLPGCPIGNHWLHAEAPGFAAQVVAIRPPLKTEPLRIQLEPGATIRVRVSDAGGVAISNAWFAFTGLIENPKADPDMPSRPLSAEFVAFTDGDGKAQWTNAPTGGAVFDFIAQGYEPLRNVRLPVDGVEHRIDMQAQVNLTIEGTVVDAQDHTPIPTFRIAVGVPTAQAPGAEEFGTFYENDSTWQQFSSGRFRHGFSKEDLRFAQDSRVIVRAEADGYEPWLSKVIRSNDGEVHFQVELQKALLRTLTIKAPDGVPAAGAELGVIRGAEVLWLKGSQFARDRGMNPVNFFRADAAGTTTVRVGNRDGHVLVAHASGYAERTFESFAKETEVARVPWSKIDVQFETLDPEAMDVWVFPIGVRGSHLQLDWETSHTKADSNGRCSLALIPPGEWLVQQYRPISRANGGATFQPGAQKRVQLADGKTASIRLGGGFQIKGKIQVPDGVVVPPTTRWVGRIRWGAGPANPPGIKPWSAAYVEWRQRPEIRRQFDEIQSRSREFIVKTDLSFTADGVEPGTYQLMLLATLENQALKLEQPLVVPEGKTPGVIDLGLIPVAVDHPKGAGHLDR